jgi:AraC family transcriptional regulator
MLVSLQGPRFRKGETRLDNPRHRLMRIEAQVQAPIATAQLVKFDFPEPIDNVMQEQAAFRLDLCLTPRPSNARACYRARWGAHRFEPIGTLFLVPPGESMLAVSDGRCRQVSVVCQLFPEPMRAWLDDEFRWTDSGLSAGLDIRDRNLRTLLLRLAEEARNPGFASEMLVEMITGQIAVELARYCRANNTQVIAGGLASWRLRLIDERLREEDGQPTLAELAELCGVSVRQLTRGFRASRGYSIGEHCANHRVEQARKRLAAGESVKVIACSLGFSSASAFCHAFRRATGVTPGQYRQFLPRTS